MTVNGDLIAKYKAMVSSIESNKIKNYILIRNKPESDDNGNYACWWNKDNTGLCVQWCESTKDFFCTKDTTTFGLSNQFNKEGRYGQEVIDTIFDEFILNDYTPDRIVKPADINKKRSPKVIPIMLDNINAFLGGWHPKSVNIIAGATGVGKSTLVNQIAIISSILAGEKVFWYNAEFDNAEGLETLLQVITDRPDAIERTLKGESEGRRHYRFSLSNNEYDRLKRLVSPNVRIYGNAINETIDNLLHTVEESYYTYGTRVVVIDNLMCLDDNDEDENRRVKNMIMKIKALANRLSLYVFIVAHNRKGSKGNEDNDSVMGTSNVPNLASTVTIISDHVDDRNVENWYIKNNMSQLKDIDNTRMIKITKNRSDGDTGKTHLVFDVKRRRYDKGTGDVINMDLVSKIKEVNANRTLNDDDFLKDVTQEMIDDLPF